MTLNNVISSDVRLSTPFHSSLVKIRRVHGCSLRCFLSLQFSPHVP